MFEKVGSHHDQRLMSVAVAAMMIRVSATAVELLVVAGEPAIFHDPGKGPLDPQRSQRS